MAERVPVPPKGLLASGHRVERAPHGWNLIIAFRSLDLADGLNHPELAALAFVQLGRWLKDQGIPVSSFVEMIDDA